MKIATYDIGTSAVKGILTNYEGDILLEQSVPLHTFFLEGQTEQDPEEWFSAFLTITRAFAAAPGEPVGAIILSGQMQDLICVGPEGRALGRAILYSDGRAEAEAAQGLSDLGCSHPSGDAASSAEDGQAFVRSVTGNPWDGSLPLPKILWLKRRDPDRFAKTSHFLFCAKDYILLRLTGVAAGDVTACSIAGGMDIRAKVWNEELVTAVGAKLGQMPRLFRTHQVVGILTPEAAALTGLPETVKVFAGIGDAGATTLASGISRPGEYNINLGTTGWVAAVSPRVAELAGGVINLAACEDGLYINVVPFLNAGNVHRWIAALLSPSPERENPDYDFLNGQLARSAPGSDGVFFLPYLSGERFPVMDARVRGAFLGLTPTTGKPELARSVLESVAYSIRQGLAQLPDAPEKISLIGGGGQVEIWNQIFADILKQDIYVYQNADTLPALALAAAVAVGEGVIPDYAAFTEKLQGEDYSLRYSPGPERTALYDSLYEKAKQLYPLVKDFYQG